jgi:hypothetical protein
LFEQACRFGQHLLALRQRQAVRLAGGDLHLPLLDRAADGSVAERPVSGIRGGLFKRVE